MSTTRRAECSCGQLALTAEGEPLRVTVCHCLACQRRTGSAFGLSARFPADRVHVEGRSSEYVRISDEGEPRTFHFCPQCGATVFYRSPVLEQEGAIAVPVGGFADPSFPEPERSIYESRRHGWVGLPDELEHYD